MPRPRRLAAVPGLPAAATLLVLAGTLLALATACGGTTVPPAGAAPGRGTRGEPLLLSPDDDVYRLAAPLARGKPGDVIAIQPVPLPAPTRPTDAAGVAGAAGTAGTAGADGTAWRMLYHSRALDGRDIAVSGIVMVPDEPAPAGGRPVLSWAHGTTGIADECAPSKHLSAEDLDRARPFLERGVVVVATDYEGLGTPGRHPYLVGESEAHGVLDAVRAARNLGERTRASNRVVVWGHSQGGHAALFANQTAADWAGELDVVGTVAGAPPSQLPLAWAALRGTPAQYYLAMVTAGWAQAYPDARPSAVFTPAGVDLLDTLDRGCSQAAALTWNGRPQEQIIAADPATVQPWSRLLRENDPGQTAGAGPVLIVHGEADEVIPVASSKLLLDRMCRTGQVVERRTYPGQRHRLEAATGDVVSWIGDRLAGKPARTSCPAG
jgi:acetyl esterase/lipase